QIGILLSILIGFFGAISIGSASSAFAQSAPSTANSTALPAESITSFHSDISINQDASLEIRETIKYQTSLNKHGIYRYIPVDYNQAGYKNRLPVSNISITDQHGNAIPFEKSTDGPFIAFKIG